LSLPIPRRGRRVEIPLFQRIGPKGAAVVVPVPIASVSAGATQLTATITDSNGNTSEFAVNIAIPVSSCPVVSSNLDDSSGSTLRDCINYVNQPANNGKNITFSISNQTITLASDLPALNAPGSDIDGTGKNVVIKCAGFTNNGLTINSVSTAGDPTNIKGLSFTSCANSDPTFSTGAGIFISGAKYVNLTGNVLGTDFTSAAGLGNTFGVDIHDSQQITIGTAPSLPPNPVCGASHNTISGNITDGILYLGGRGLHRISIFIAIT